MTNLPNKVDEKASQADTIRRRLAAPGGIDRALDFLGRLLRSPQSGLPESAAKSTPEMISSMVEALEKPANSVWISARVIALLEGYYDKEIPDSVRKVVASLWVDALAPYPAWAIDRAMRWWRGPENQHRHRKPVEGDIAARAIIEMDAVRAARIRLNAGTGWPAAPAHGEDRGPRITPERAAEIMAEVGWTGGKAVKGFREGEADAE